MATLNAVIDPATFSAAPGATTTGEIRVRNDGTEAEHIRFEMRGDDRAWTVVSPAAHTLAPGEEGVSRIYLRPPRSPSVPAGAHQLQIAMRSDSDRRAETLVAADIDLLAYEDVKARIGPAVSGQPSSFRLSIDNRGNAPVKVTIGAAHPEGKGAGGPDPVPEVYPSTLTIAAGSMEDVAVQVRGRRPLIGSGSARPFAVSVTPDGGEPVLCEATASQAPVLSGRRAGIGVAALVVVAVIALVVSSLGSSSKSKPTSNSNSAPATPVVQPQSGSCPGAGHLAHDANGEIRHTVIEPDNFSFLYEKTGGCLPIRWNPCEPIHYVVNPGSATAAQMSDVTQAVADNAKATGLQFVYDGTTSADGRDYAPFQPAVFGDRWAPVLIEWEHLGGGSNLTEVAGGGFPDQASGVYVSGGIVLNLDAHLQNNAIIPDGFGGGVTWGRIILHELGHVVGLGHVTSPTELMHEPVTEQTSPSSAYGFGDLAGLRLLGRSAGCLTTPPPGPNASPRGGGQSGTQGPSANQGPPGTDSSQ